MNYISEKNERRGRTHAMVLAVALHLALATMLYFQMTANEIQSNPAPPAKVNRDSRTALNT